MRTLSIALAGCFFALFVGTSAKGDDLTSFNQQDWERYEATQAVIRSMPASLRRQGGYSFRGLASVESDPSFKAWAALAPMERLDQRNEFETRLASNRAIRQTAVGGYWAFNNPYSALMQPSYGYGYSTPFLASPFLGMRR